MKQSEKATSWGSWEMDPETGRFICSAEMYNMLDWPPEKSFEKKDLSKLIHPEERAKILAIFEKAVDERNSFEVETRLKIRDGKIRPFRFRASFIESQNGGRPRLSGVIQDITDLKEDSKFSKTLINTTTDGYLLLSMKTDAVLDVNPAYCRMTGYSREQLLRMNIFDLDVNLESEEFKREVQNILKQGAGRFETRHRNRNGEIIHVEISLTVIRKQDNELVVAFVRDITDEKKARRRLKESEERWQRLVKNNPQPVQIVQDGKIAFINQAGAELYGATNPDSLVGKKIIDFSHRETIEEIKERKDKLENKQHVEPSEHKIKRLDGSERFIAAHSIPIRFEGDTAIQTVLYDLTEREEQQKIVRSSLKEKEMLLKEIHHRVKNNLSVISGLLELQAMNADDESTLNTLRDSQQRIHSMAMIHEKLYQSEALSDIGFDKYLKELVESISHTYNTDKLSIDINFDLESVSLDLDQAIPTSLIVNEVIVNCYKHAFKESEEGIITITSTFDDPEMIIEIKDNGRGLSEDFSINEQQSLGMTLVQTLTRQLDGKIGFSSNDGAGTTFKLRFEKE